jgi:hypothetical protein
VNRRSGPWVLRILFALSLVVALVAPSTASAAGTTPATAPPSTDPTPTTTEVVVDEANPFLPEDRDLTTCVGTLERPGCGSKARGGWHQNLVAIAMVGGLLIVFGRVAWGVRRSQKQPSPGNAGD